MHQIISRIQAMVLALTFWAGCAIAGTNTPSMLPPVVSSPVIWGETNAGLQLSLSVDHETIKSGSKLTLYLKTRNHTKTNIVLDASLPSRNGSEIIVICPDGTRTGKSSWIDMGLRLNIPAGETDFGGFVSENWFDFIEYNPKKEGNTKFDEKRLLGLHKITWKLGRTLSNSVEVKVE